MWGILTPHYHKDKKSTKIINKEISELIYTFEHVDLIDTYIVFHPTKTAYALFSAANSTLSKIDCMLVHKACFNTTELKLHHVYDQTSVKWKSKSIAKEMEKVEAPEN